MILLPAAAAAAATLAIVGAAHAGPLPAAAKDVSPATSAPARLPGIAGALAALFPFKGGARETSSDATTSRSKSITTYPTIITPSNRILSNELKLHFKKYLDYSMAGYSYSVHDRKTWSCTGCCSGATGYTKVVQPIGRNGFPEAYGAITIHHPSRTIIVIFRGTHTVSDIIADLDLDLDVEQFPSFHHVYKTLFLFTTTNITLSSTLDRPEGMMLHKGIKAYYTVVRNMVQGIMYELSRKYPDFTIVFTGHSLGGSIASIAAVDFVDLNGINQARRVEVYTFGQPRTGNAQWANWFNTIPFKGVYRITRQKDAVPHLPPLELGYAHFGQEYGIDVSDNLISCTNTGYAGETQDCQNVNLWWPDKDMHTGGYFNRTACID